MKTKITTGYLTDYFNNTQGTMHLIINDEKIGWPPRGQLSGLSGD
jgi:hypothetical protein